jgi:hypothetical protein
MNRPNRDQSKSIGASHGDITVIGDFWNSYVFESYRPSRINGIPHQHDFNRNYRHNQKAFKNDTILIFGRGWLEGYPDTVYQYGEQLLKVEEKPSYLNNYGVYVHHPLDTLNYKFFDVHNSVPSYDSLLGVKHALIVKPYEPQFKPEVEGPKKLLDRGFYRFTFFIRGVENKPVKNLKLEVNGLTSRHKYIEEYLPAQKIQNDIYQAFFYEVKLEQPECMDFNVYLGQDKGEVWFKELIIEKLDEE